jgi:hypothetical protein
MFDLWKWVFSDPIRSLIVNLVLLTAFVVVIGWLIWDLAKKSR